jgi:YD repeat-containing protein/YVTN family beta-propeller protein
LVVGILTGISAPAASASSPLPGVSQQSEAYVAVSNPPELETVDSNNGSVVGTPLPLACVPVGVDEFYTDTSAPSEIVVAEKSGTTGQCPTYNNNQVQMVDASNGVLSTPQTLASTPTAIVQSHDVHYALILEPSLHEVQVFDTYTNAVVGSVSVGSTGDQMTIAMDPYGQEAYVADATSHKVFTVAFQSTAPYWNVANTYTGSSSFKPTSIALAPGAASTAYLSDGTSIDVANTSGTFSLSGSISLGATAGDAVVNPADTMLYVGLGTQIAAVSLSNYSVTYWTWPVTTGRMFMSHDGTVLGVIDASSGTLDLLNPTNGTMYNSVGLDGTAADVIVAGQQTDFLLAWVVQSGANKVSAFDPYTTSDRQDIPLGANADPVAVATSPDGAYAYVANKGLNSVSVIETDLLQTKTSPLVATISVGASPDALAVDPAGDRLLVANSGAGTINVIDLVPTDANFRHTIATISGTGSVIKTPNSIAFSPDGRFAYFTDPGAAKVDILQNSSETWWWFGQTATISSSLESIAISPNGQTAYVVAQNGSNNGSLDHYPITSSGNFGATGGSYPVKVAPVSVALSPEGTYAYVTNSGSSNSISQVSLASGAVTNFTSSGNISGPVGMAISPDEGVWMETNASAATMSFFDSANNYLGTYNFNAGANPQAIAFSRAFDRPNDGSFAGNEQDVNPVIGATQNGIDVTDGVNTATGGYITSIDDLSLPDIGTTLDLSQEYDSANASTDGPLGYGWSFSYGMTATQEGAGTSSTACDITITEGNGTKAIFYPPDTQAWTSSCPSGSTSHAYQSPTWEQASLSVVANCNGADSCWDMTANGTTQYLFDQTNGELIRETDPNGRSVTLSYDTSNRLASVTGPSGNRYLTFDYTPISGSCPGTTICKVTDSAGRTATFSYSSGNLATVTLSASGDPTSHVWAFSYDGSNRLVDWWSPDNQSTEASYPCSGSNAFNANAVCEATQVAYSSSGMVTKVAAPEWATQCNGSAGTPYCLPLTKFSYPSFDTTTRTGTVVVTDPNYNNGNANGDVTLDSYSDGVLTGQVNGYGNQPDGTTPVMATAISYSVADPFTWLPALSFDGNANETITTFDSSGLPLSVKDPMGRKTSYIYNKYNEVLEKTDPLGYVTSYTYDANGNKLTETDPAGDVTSYAYNSSGEQCAMLNADGYASPNNDRLTTCPTGSAPYVTAYGYDGAGDQTSVTEYDGTGNTVSNTYVQSDLFNSAGEQCASLTADGYAAGNRIPSTCPTSGANYETVDTAFDVFGNDLSEISPTNSSGGTTTTTFDPSGDETSNVTSGSGGTTMTTTYTPDGYKCWSAPLAYSSPTCTSPPPPAGSQTTTYFYDPSGNEVGTVAPDGNANGPSCLYETTSGFDNLGRVVSGTTPTGGTSCANENTVTTSFTYDPAGHRLTTVAPQPPGQSGTVTTTSTYDTDGEPCWTDVQVVSNPTCGSTPTGAGTETTSYVYNADGEETGTVPPDGNQSSTPSNYETTTVFDAAGRESSETVPPASGSGAGETTMNYYDAAGNVVAVTGPGGSPATCNPATTSSCTDTTYSTYDEQGNLLSSTDTSGETTSYTYDADGNQLSAAPPSGGSTSYTYDGGDNRISTTLASSTSTDYYDTNGNEVAVAGPGGPGSCNPLTTSGCPYTTYYTYNPSGKLVTRTNPDGR